MPREDDLRRPGALPGFRPGRTGCPNPKRHRRATRQRNPPGTTATRIQRLPGARGPDPHSRRSGQEPTLPGAANPPPHTPARKPTPTARSAADQQCDHQPEPQNKEPALGATRSGTHPQGRSNTMELGRAETACHLNSLNSEKSAGPLHTSLYAVPKKSGRRAAVPREGCSSSPRGAFTPAAQLHRAAKGRHPISDSRASPIQSARTVRSLLGTRNIP
jgi:hypothetical protein